MSHMQARIINNLIGAPFHKFRGTDMAYRFATLDGVGNKFTLAGIIKNPLDRIDNAKEVQLLLEYASPRIKINTVLMGRDIWILM